MHVSHLFRYPLKSGRGVSETLLMLDPWGVVGDRRLMAVRASDGRFLSQRDTEECPGTPRMALISALIAEGACVLTAPGMPELRVDLQHASGVGKVSIHRDRELSVSHLSEDADRWLSEFLGIDAQLVQQPPDFARAVDPVYSPSGDSTSFSDGFPLLLISDASLAELNGRLDSPVGIENFRPNIVVSGVDTAYAEDGWKAIRIGSVTFDLVKPCGRCVIINNDPAKGVRGKGGGPLAALRRYRAIRRDGNIAVLFGENLIHREKSGTIHCGDEVQILAFRAEAERPQLLLA